jgi:hypothetical protein
MTNNQKIGVAIGATSVVSLIVGAASGYFLAKKRLEKTYSDFASEEIAEARRFYTHNKQFSTPAEAVEALIPDEVAQEAEAHIRDKSAKVAEALKTYQGEPDVKQPETTETVEVNIFGRSVGYTKADWEQTFSMRDEDEPHIISSEEFLEGGPGYNNPTFTYYAGDDVLADERDQPITGSLDLVGEGNLRFGLGSDDPNVVYIRNNKISLDMEIVKSEGKYAEEVAGFHHPKHSSG